MLLGTATTTGALLAILATILWVGGADLLDERESVAGVAMTDTPPSPSVESTSTNESGQGAELPPAINESVDWQPEEFWAEAVSDSQLAPSGDGSLHGARLLARRYYDLETDTQGRIIAARLPVDGRGRRFGPSSDEIAALKELPHLRRLDLRDTISSAAVPIANSLPQLRVLVLENQTGVESFRGLRNVNELHLVDSPIDVTILAASGIKVVQSEASY